MSETERFLRWAEREHGLELRTYGGDQELPHAPYDENVQRLLEEFREQERQLIDVLTEQRRALWMLLDHLDTLDDAWKGHDDLFRKLAYMLQRKRFEIWDPKSDEEVMGTQQRINDWVRNTLGDESADDVRERSLRAVEEALELAQVCDVDPKVLHKLVDYVFERPVGEAPQKIAGCLITLYAAATALQVNADDALRAELLRIKRPEVIERVRRRQIEKREALVTDLSPPDTRRA